MKFIVVKTHCANEFVNIPDFGLIALSDALVKKIKDYVAHIKEMNGKGLEVGHIASFDPSASYIGDLDELGIDYAGDTIIVECEEKDVHRLEQECDHGFDCCEVEVEDDCFRFCALSDADYRITTDYVRFADVPELSELSEP
jgi:hypothetical protein